MGIDVSKIPRWMCKSYFEPKPDDDDIVIESLETVSEKKLDTEASRSTAPKFSAGLQIEGFVESNTKTSDCHRC